MVKPIPEGYHSITPYLIVEDAKRALAFYAKAFSAQELMRMDDPSGKIMHAEMLFGDSHVMLADEFPQMGVKGPKSYGGSPQSLMFYVENVDEVFEKAVSEGGIVKRPLENQFYGDRTGTIEDPFGHSWTIATHVEDLSPEEMEKRAAEAMKKP